MRLFDSLPESFFSILVGKNKDVYAMALSILYKSLQTDEMSIKKDDFLRMLRENLSDLVMKLDLEEESDEEELIANPSLNSRSAFIVRRMQEVGWIDVQIHNESFDEYIALPSFSIKFLSVLNEITNESEVAYNSLVHSTYSELKLEDEMPDEHLYLTLLRAYENTKKLRIELVTLGHSIRIFQHKLGSLFTTNEVLRDHFDEYKVRISDRLYHPLKTFDSVSRFKRPIIAILQKWLRNDEIRNRLVSQSFLWRKTKDASEAESDLIEKINYIQDMYEQLDRMILDIDNSHSEYTKSTASKIIYFNNNDKTIKGHLETIFKSYAKANSMLETQGQSKDIRFILSSMQDSLNFHEQGYIDPESITLPIVRQYRMEGEPMQIINNLDEAGDFIMQNFLDQTRNNYSDARIYSFMETAFGTGDYVEVEDIPLPDYDAFILVILATLRRNDEHCFYVVEMEDGSVATQGYILPRMAFRRKESLTNV